ncbi:hypothetical protein BJX64DRAFT_259319 [Aspergillus heterothallicus]
MPLHLMFKQTSMSVLWFVGWRTRGHPDSFGEAHTSNRSSRGVRECIEIGSEFLIVGVSSSPRISLSFEVQALSNSTGDKYGQK